MKNIYLIPIMIIMLALYIFLLFNIDKQLKDCKHIQRIIMGHHLVSVCSDNTKTL